MYHKYFGLEEAPFSIAVNPRYLFMSERHRDALAHLLYGVGVGGGFILLTGEVGTGKTTITRCLLEQLPPKTDVALILNPALDAAQLLAAICDELHIDYRAEERNLKELTDKLHRFLLENHQRGRNTVLLIDEAQHLQFEALEHNTRKLLQIILVGQPELKVMLARPELRQLSQRVTARYQLKPLTLDETAGYIRHRLQVAGLHANQELFPPRVVQHIHSESQGIPRLINVLCDRILLGTYGQNKSRVDMAMARQATLEVKGEDEQRSAGSARWAWPAAGALLALTAVGAFLWWQAQQADIATLAGDTEALAQGGAPAADGQSAPVVSPAQPAPAESGPQPVVIVQTPVVPATLAANAVAAAAPPREPAPVPLVAAGVGVQAPPASVGAGAAGDTVSAVDSSVPLSEEPAVAEPIVIEPGVADAIVLEPTEVDASAVESTAASAAEATATLAAATEPIAAEPTAAEPDRAEPTAAETASEQAVAETLAPAATGSRTTAAGAEQMALDEMVFTDLAAALSVLLLHEGVIDTPLGDPCGSLASEGWRCDTLQANSWPQLLTYKSPVVMEVLTTLERDF
jgi:type II secretory pathway predicted ATPase ExeA